MRTYNGKVETSLWHCSIGICKGCHYYGYDRGEYCMKQLIKEAYQAHLSDERALENQLKKIKELKAEIDELQHKNSDLEIELKAMRGAANSYKAEAERLKNWCDVYSDEGKGAIKEFAEELSLDIQRNLMPNVDDDGTVTVENAERYFLARIKEMEQSVNYKSSKTEE